MKHQYFGDENDFRKYGLLRGLSGLGKLTTGVCWMLTPNDDSADGGLTMYLSRPDLWRHYDPPLFDALRMASGVEERHVGFVESHSLLPSTLFHETALTDHAVGRTDYFRDALARFRGVDLVFFDPDNGFQVKSRPRGCKDSAKHVFWDEISSAYEAGHSVLVYQHFPRVPRAVFTSNLVSEAVRRVNTRIIHTFSTSRVLFVLLVQDRHSAVLCQNATHTGRAWAGLLVHQHHETDCAAARES